MIPLKSWKPRQCRHRSHLARMLKHHHHHYRWNITIRSAGEEIQLVPYPVQLLWNPEEAIETHPQLQKVERSMSRWGNCLLYVLLIFLTIWNSVIFRWWEPSPKRRGTPHEISMNSACFVIFICMFSTWRQSAYFVVSFRSPSEIILPWCLIISTKSPPFFLPILIMKPKVSLTFSIQSQHFKDIQTTDPALFTNIGII